MSSNEIILSFMLECVQLKTVYSNMNQVLWSLRSIEHDTNIRRKIVWTWQYNALHPRHVSSMTKPNISHLALKNIICGSASEWLIIVHQWRYIVTYWRPESKINVRQFKTYIIAYVTTLDYFQLLSVSVLPSKVYLNNVKSQNCYPFQIISEY